MIGTEFLKGQGLGNQLFCYVSARCIAKELGFAFGTAGQQELAVNIHSKKGMYFMDLDLGTLIEDTAGYERYQEKELRMYTKTCVHDMKHGCYIAGPDDDIYKIKDHTLIYGNLQAKRYFGPYKEEVVSWLKVKPSYDSYEFTKDNLCILNMRGGEYVGNRALYLNRSYWKKAMAHMRQIKSDMEFMIVTDDVEAARRQLPEVKAFHFDLDKDYVTIKNAKYLILSNSSFGFFPAYTSTTVEKIIAPMYWARYQVSDGYWASEQNLYDEFTYMDKTGNLYTAAVCQEKLNVYKNSPLFQMGTPFGEAACARQAGKERALYYGEKGISYIRRRLKHG